MVPARIYTERRNRLNEQLKGEPAVFAAFSAMQQTNDSAAPFVQESNFLWLTGIPEPDWCLVICDGESWLISPEKTAIQRIFDGGMSDDEARHISGVDNVLTGEAFDALLVRLAEKHTAAHAIFKHAHDKYFDFVMNPSLRKIRKKAEAVFSEVHDCRKQLAQLKAIKTDDEVALIEQAIAVTMRGFEEVKRQLPSASHEYELEATLGYVFRSAGTQGHAYQPIVGTGKNACTLHYIDNKDPLPKAGMVLIDAGARVDGYAADITRTYAIGEPSDREKKVHAEVEKAHEAIIESIKPGLTFKDYDAFVDETMKAALEALGLLNEPDDYRTYFPHAVSHGLGIDVHDSLGGFTSLQAGMVLTVEPGIYIPEEGIGVRIEDDILVTKEGHRNLSAELPTSL
jgi:Xaa-Pro aminopeptidase